MTVITVAEFAPDLPDIPASTSDSIFNVVPLSALSYGPLPSIQSYATALTARCQGAFSATDTSQNVRLFAGDATKLYRMTASSTTPADVSKVSGYTTSSSGQWSYALFGNRVIATNYNDAPQSYVDGTSALFANLIATGSTTLKAKYVANVMEWIVFANTTDGTYGTQPQRVWWSAINDPTNFPTPGTQAAANALSDFQDNLGDHGQIQGIVGNLGTASAAIFYERAVYRMTYAGLPDIFSFSQAQGTPGALCPGGIVKFGQIAYYLGEDGFYAFDGTSSQPIGKSKLDKYVLSDLNYTYLDRVTSATDPARGLVIWAYPGAGSSNGICNRLVIYSPFLNRFTMTDTTSVNVEALVKAATFGKTLEQLDSFGTIETLAYSLDSAVWSGGANVFAGFDSSHRFGYFNGSNLAATIDTSDYEADPHNTTMINFAFPLCDTTSVTMASAARQRIQDAISYSSANAINSTGRVPLRSRGHYHRLRSVIPSGTSWSYFSGVDVDPDDMTTLGGR